MRRNKGFLIFSLFVFVLIVASLLTSYESATGVNLDLQNKAPSLCHLFGTDELGRDVLFRCLYGLKMSLTIGFLATCVDVILGTVLGLLSALVKEPFRGILSRFLDVMTILPQMLLSLLVLMIVKDGFYSIIIAISLTGWLPTARALRAEMMKLKTSDFIKALYGLGYKFPKICVKHLFPSCLPTLIISSALCLPSAIFSEAFMSFLGLGVAPPTPSLGNMIADGLPALAYFPWRLLAPCFMIFIVIVSMLTLIEKLKSRMSRAL